jgi:hypothetical protein
MGFAVSRRTAWLFPNGYLLVIVHSFGPHITYLHEMISWDSLPPVPEGLQNEWKVENYANGWRPSSDPHEFPPTDSILEILEVMTEVNGEPKLIVPWRETWAQGIAAEGDDYFTGNSFQDRDVDPERQSVQDMFKCVLDGGLERQSPWKVEFTNSEEYMPKFCSYMELIKFLDELERQKLAIVVRNVFSDYTKEEHAEEIRAENSDRGQLPIVWVPSDYASNTYFGNGWVNELVIYVDNPELEKNMYILADEMDLSLFPKWTAEEVEREDWEAGGIFEIVSDFD